MGKKYEEASVLQKLNQHVAVAMEKVNFEPFFCHW